MAGFTETFLRVGPPFRSGYELISCAVDGEQVTGICRIRLQLLAQFKDLIIYGSGSRIAVVAPDLIEEFFPADTLSAWSVKNLSSLNSCDVS